MVGEDALEEPPSIHPRKPKLPTDQTGAGMHRKNLPVFTPRARSSGARKPMSGMQWEPSIHPEARGSSSPETMGRDALKTNIHHKSRSSGPPRDATEKCSRCAPGGCSAP